VSKTPILDGYLTITETAAELLVCKRTLKRWRSFGEGPRQTRVGKKILYHRDDILNWLQQQRGPSSNGGGHD
jgi:hypothetical protein